jgi:hypothetical protein
LLAGSSAAAALVRRAAFTSLRQGNPASVPVLAEATRQPLEAVRAALAELVTAGTANLNADQDVVAVGGLSVIPAAHRLRLDGVDLWTWCAYDGVGIPAALRVDGLARTRCPQCGKEVEVSLSLGRPPADSPIVGWLPHRPCNNVQADFCPEANLFCNSDHLSRWRREAGDPPGERRSLSELAALGEQVWAEMRNPGEDRDRARGAPPGPVEVTLLYFDGCPNWLTAEANLQEALAITGLTDTLIHHRKVETIDEAQRLRFTGSPTILIDGVDPLADPAAPGGLACRLYATPDGVAGAPTVEQLRSALESAGSRCFQPTSPAGNA